MQLGKVCHLNSGVTARRRLEPAISGGVPAIQMRDVQFDAELNVGDLRRYNLENLSERHLVSGGEVIFRSRGCPNTAVVVSGELEEPAAVILPLVILRPKGELVLPEYLAWTINRPETQRHLDSAAQGTSMRMISKAALEGIEIPIPEIEFQRRIVAVHGLARREGSLLRELANSREELNRIILAERARLADRQGIPQ